MESVASWVPGRTGVAGEQRRAARCVRPARASLRGVHAAGRGEYYQALRRPKCKGAQRASYVIASKLGSNYTRCHRLVHGHVVPRQSARINAGSSSALFVSGDSCSGAGGALNEPRTTARSLKSIVEGTESSHAGVSRLPLHPLRW